MHGKKIEDFFFTSWYLAYKTFWGLKHFIILGGGDKWVISKTVRWTPPGLFSG